jgi:outer membrane murein-binding lipoprotein Lpp
MKNMKTLVLGACAVLALAGCAANAQTDDARGESTFRNSQSK